MLKPTPGLHCLVQPAFYNSLERFQRFGDTTFTGAVVADEHSQGRESDEAAVPHGFEMLEAE
jgi:hypothetical protein